MMPFCPSSSESRAGPSQAAVFGACKFFMGSDKTCCQNETLTVNGAYASAGVCPSRSLRGTLRWSLLHVRGR